MPTYDSTTKAAMAAGHIIKRDLLTIFGKDEGGSAAEYGFWDGDGNVTLTVVSATDGSSDSRTYVGGGTVLRMPPFPATVGLETRDVEVVLSQIDTSVQALVRSYDIRGAIAEVHRAFYSASTGGLVAAPLAVWRGVIMQAPLETPAAGGEGGISLRISSGVFLLARANPTRKSHEQQKLRGGDLFRKYSSRSVEFNRVWGEKRGKKA